MPIDYGAIPTPDLEALKSGDYSKVSTSTLEMIKGDGGEAPAAPKQPAQWRDLPSNILPSAGRYAGNIWQAVRHPIDTATTLGKSAVGAAELLIPGEQGQEPYARAIGDYLKNRFGGTENIKETMITDPVGLLGDIAGVATGAGAGLKLAGFSKAAGTAGKVARYTEPLNAVTKGISTIGTKAIPNAFLTKLYESAIKGPTVIDPLKRAETLQVGLERGIPPSRGGYAKLQGIVNELRNKIDAEVAAGAQAGDTIPVSKFTQYFNEARQNIINRTPDPDNSLAYIDALEKSITNHPNVVNGEMPVELAMEMKRGIQQKLSKGKKYGQMETWDVETQKQMARGILDGLVEKYPELKPLGLEVRDLLQFKDFLRNAVNRVGNRDFLGAGLLWGMEAGGALGGQAGAVAGAIARMVTSEPQLSARLASMLYRAKKGITPQRGTINNAIRAAVGPKSRALANQAGALGMSPLEANILGGEAQ